MHRYLRWAFVAAGLSVPFVAGGFLFAMRSQPLTDAQKTALGRLTEPTPPVRGRDASDVIWLLDRDVPAERRHEVASQVRAYEAEQGKPARFHRDPRQDWPKFPEPAKGGEGTCKTREPGCLAYVSENRPLVAATLAANAGALSVQRQIADYDGFRRGFEPNSEFKYPPYSTYRRLLTSSFALRFSSGGPFSAIEDVCRDLAAWRRIGGDSDDMVNSMTGVAWVREDLMLLSEMLAKLPRNSELPDACTPALAPSANFEYSLCPELRSEFALSRDARSEFQGYASDGGSWLPLWTVDWRRYEARIAEDLGQFCNPAWLPKLRADARASALITDVPACTEWERRADYLGCALYYGRAGQWAKYQDRRADQAQMLALMRLVVWLRGEVDSKDSVPAALSRIPAEVGLLRKPSYDPDSDRLSLPLHDTTHHPDFGLTVGAEAPASKSRQRRYCCRARTSRNLALL